MGNYAYLRGLNAITGDVDDSSIVRSAANSLPVFWLAAFAPENRHIFNLPLNDSPSIQVPALIAATSQTYERLSGRSDFLRACLPVPLHPVLETWQAWLARISSPYLGLDPAELSLMLETQDIESWLIDSTSAFDDHSPEKLTAAFDVLGLDFDPEELRVVAYDSSLADVALTGF